MNLKKIIILICMIFLLCGCKSQTSEELLPEENPIVTMTIEDYGEIKIELYPEYAYNTVANFVNLVEDGFYDNNAITRVQKGFVIQGGGTKQLDYTIKGEFKENGYDKNTLSHTKGVISMARSSSNDSANGQFFIVLSDSAKSSLDGKYAGFGKVISGMDVIEKIESDDFDYADETYYFLNNYITIESATVDTKGYSYKVQKIKS